MNRKLKFISVVGARPNFMKVAPLHRAFSKIESIEHLIVHTGQHYDNNMSKVFFDDLELPKPDVYLGVGSGTHAEQTAKVMVEFEKVLAKERPDLIIVVGDVNSTVACSLTASKLLIPVAHVEAGLRSFDRTMPEEINRMVTDVLSDFLFVTEESGVVNLKHEGISEKKIFLVGDVMIDSLMMYREKAKKSAISYQLFPQTGSSTAISGQQSEVSPRSYTLVTLHRPSNVDEKKNMETILKIFKGIEGLGKIVFPIHPRTRKRIEEFGLSSQFAGVKNLVLVDPLGYLDFLNLMMDARIILTDSGGIQEESTFLNVPCITMRENTERPVTIEVGTNVLAGLSVNKVVSLAEECYAGKWKKSSVPELWDGKAAERIAEVLHNSFEEHPFVVSQKNTEELNP
ncbi:MAG: UDP-N-acetylglucosamine 2-epimerase (non-hydrolyzing) [Bacteroidetes bacterium]|nr:UDP-N-acetylglucosamine 2-epimerase (non-hydrolyzing) [Bacteroidota bacterium]MCL5738971.1 UDP-N-acetylglucosamine 2-epimerase (non-hydrolyzing) [Bacteroidota bacterium]